MKNAKRISFGNNSKQYHFKTLVCIGLLFMTISVFLVPQSIQAQEFKGDINDTLVPENEPDKSDKDKGTDSVVVTVTEPGSRGSICQFRMEGDYVHKSGSDASGHGWWVNTDCNAVQAHVTIQLQQNIYGWWADAGPLGQKTVYSGGGSGNRAATRAHCNSNTTTSWRSVIDVDLIGVADTPFKLYTSTRVLDCRH